MEGEQELLPQDAAATDQEEIKIVSESSTEKVLQDAAISEQTVTPPNANGSNTDYDAPPNDGNTTDDDDTSNASVLEDNASRLSAPYRLSHVIEGLVGPFGLAVSPAANRLVVNEWTGHSVTILDFDGRNRVTFGRRPATEKSLTLRRLSGLPEKAEAYRHGPASGQLYGPTSVAITFEGNVIVADSENHRLQVFSMDGSPVAILGSSKSLQYPYEVAVDDDGQVYVSDTFHHCIQVYSRGLVHSHTIGRRGSGEGEFSHPLGIAIDSSSGTMYVCDRDNSRVQKLVASNGEYMGEFKCTWLQYPVKVAVDSANKTLLVSYSYSSMVALYDTRTGSHLGYLGLDGKQLFKRPRGMAINGDQLLVCDSIKDQVMVFVQQT